MAGFLICMGWRDFLFAWDLVNSLLMASSFKFSREVLVHNLSSHVFIDEASRHYQYVGIVMLTDEVSNLGNPAETGTDALVFVECHVDTLTRTADGDTREYLTLLDTLC